MYIKIVLYLLSTTPPGFRGDHRDRAMRDLDVPPVESEHDHGEGDPDLCPEDEEYFVRPDAAEMEKAIGKFFYGLAGALWLPGNAQFPCKATCDIYKGIRWHDTHRSHCRSVLADNGRGREETIYSLRTHLVQACSGIQVHTLIY